jgi:branched-chain amino acid aminotransferase
MYYNENTIVFFNGEWLKSKDLVVSPYAQAMHYGSGVFEGIRAYETPDGTRIFKSKEHYERLLFSANKMHLKVNYNEEQFTQLTYQLLEKNNLSNAYIRPLIFAGTNMSLTPTDEVHILLCAWEWGKYLGTNLLNVMTSSYQRPNPKSCHVDAKVTGHYVNSILATTEAKNNGFDEALLLDANGYVAEGPGANFFFEQNEVLYTSPIGNILPGITRATIFELCKELGFKIVEKYFTPEEIKGADSAFFKLNWEDSLGYILQAKYNRRVAFNEYGNFSLV